MAEPTTPQLELPRAYGALLQRLTRALALTTDSAAFISAALSELDALLRPALVQVLLVNRDRDELTPAAFVGPAPMAEGLPLRLLPTLTGILTSRQPALVERLAESPLAAELGPLLRAEIGALLLLPLIAQGMPVGALLLAAAPGASFAPADAALGELAASSLTAALYVGRLSDAMKRRSDQFAMVADIAARVSSSLEPREVYRLIVQKLNEYFQVGAGSLLLKDDTTDEMIFVMTLEGAEEKLHGRRLPRCGSSRSLAMPMDELRSTSAWRRRIPWPTSARASSTIWTTATTGWRG